MQALQRFWSFVKDLYRPLSSGRALLAGVVVPLVVLIRNLLPDEQANQWATALRYIPAISWYLFLVIIVLFMGVFGVVRAYQLHASSVRIFADRNELTPGRLVQELRSSNAAVWAVWPAGYAVPGLPPDAVAKLTRLMLGDADDAAEVLKRYAADHSVRDSEHVRQVVREATRAAQAARVQVRWHSRRDISLVISDPESSLQKGWARIELPLPHLHASSRPSIFITQESYPTLFAALVQMYNSLWNLGRDAPVQTGDPDELTIQTARYGFGSDPVKWVDVSDAVRAQIRNKRLNFTVTSAALNCEGDRDPFPQQKKFLEVEYSVGGISKPKISVKERQQIILPSA